MPGEEEDVLLPGEVREQVDEPEPQRSLVTSLDLPLEQVTQVPDELIASFEHCEVNEEDGDFFNDLGRRFPRDNMNRVNNNEELINAVNSYDYDLPCTSKCTAYFLSAISLGGYAYMKQRTIPAGYFGHYTSMGRHMLTDSGMHTLLSNSERWLDDVPIEKEDEHIRYIGIKTLITVPENHIAGGFRLCGSANAKEAGDDEDIQDGEFVLFGQGRHVLDTSFYQQVVISKLENDKVALGPVTVLYVKEGMIGGAYERTTGTFILFHPGPPYILHQKDYEDIQLVKRELDGFRIGPMSFITVKDGEIAGAYHKLTGKYQLLPPGHSYKLHEKDYEAMDKKQRSNFFKLGPYTFVTVQIGHIAGAFHKKNGKFILLPPGETYQLNDDDFCRPTLTKRDTHVVKCGPFTFLTLREGFLMGAYRTDDGMFEEFSSDDNNQEVSEYQLHEKDYHQLEVVPKYSHKVQTFGPNKIVTIPEGSCGVFQREGTIEIKEPGFYKVSAEYVIRENIPLYVNSERFEGHEFLTKDSVLMRMSSVFIWKVCEPALTARWPGTLQDLVSEFRSKAIAGLVMLLRCLTRAQLMPTRQDVLMKTSTEGEEMSADEIEEKVKKAADNSKQHHVETEKECLEQMNQASKESGWGLQVVSVKLDTLEVADEHINADMQAIAQSQITMKRRAIEGREAMAAATLKRQQAMQRAQVNSEVAQAQAESASRVKIAEARAQSEIGLMQSTSAAKAQAEAKKIELEMQLQLEESQAALEESKATRAARAEGEAKKIELETQRHIAEAQFAIEETKLRARQLASETEADGIKALAEAQYEKGRKQQEVAAMMPSQEYDIKRLELVVKAMKHFSHAAWRHPEDAQRAHLHSFWEEMKPYMRLGGMGAEDMQHVMWKASSSHA